jgi:hypothetical protein
LTETLGRYADENTDIGRRATAAASDVKTFTHLLDTLGKVLLLVGQQRLSLFSATLKRARNFGLGLKTLSVVHQRFGGST